MDLGQFSNQLIERDLTFGCDTRIYPIGHPSQLSMSGAIPPEVAAKVIPLRAAV